MPRLSTPKALVHPLIKRENPEILSATADARTASANSSSFGQTRAAYRDFTVSGTNDPGGRLIEFQFRLKSSQPIMSSEEDDPLTGLIDRSRRAQVRDALEQMRPDDRDLLRLLYVEGLETAEVASRLGIDAGTLRVRKHRALLRLAAIVGGGNVSGRAGTEGEA